MTQWLQVVDRLGVQETKYAALCPDAHRLYMDIVQVRVYIIATALMCPGWKGKAGKPVELPGIPTLCHTVGLHISNTLFVSHQVTACNHGYVVDRLARSLTNHCTLETLVVLHSIGTNRACCRVVTLTSPGTDNCNSVATSFPAADIKLLLHVGWQGA